MQRRERHPRGVQQAKRLSHQSRGFGYGIALRFIEHAVISCETSSKFKVNSASHSPEEDGRRLIRSVSDRLVYVPLVFCICSPPLRR